MISNHFSPIFFAFEFKALRHSPSFINSINSCENAAKQNDCKSIGDVIFLVVVFICCIYIFPSLDALQSSLPISLNEVCILFTICLSPCVYLYTFLPVQMLQPVTFLTQISLRRLSSENSLRRGVSSFKYMHVVYRTDAIPSSLVTMRRTTVLIIFIAASQPSNIETVINNSKKISTNDGKTITFEPDS